MSYKPVETNPFVGITITNTIDEDEIEIGINKYDKTLQKYRWSTGKQIDQLKNIDIKFIPELLNHCKLNPVEIQIVIQRLCEKILN